MHPPGLIEYAFGKNSFRRHVRAAEQAGAAVQVYHSSRVALDLDTPADLELYYDIAENIGALDNAGGWYG